MKKVTIVLLGLILIWSCSNDESANSGNNENNNEPNVSANQLETGASSNDLLSDSTFTSLYIEVVYVEGFAPTQNTIDNFVNFLDNRIYKPDGITVETRSIVTPGTSPYTNQEIRDIEDTNRTKYNTDNQIAVWAFFADGESDSNSGSGVILGTAYRNTSFVIYEETIQDLSNSPLEPNRSVLETTVINHEFGHILGLTNLGTQLQSDHEDSSHPKHCNVEECLMYWSAESGSGVENLVGISSAPPLDLQCIADLQANGGK